MGGKPKYVFSGGYKCWQWKKTLRFLRLFMIGCMPHEFILTYDGKKIMECTYLKNAPDEWKPFKLIVHKGIPHAVYRDIVKAIKSGQIRMPYDP